MEQKCTKEKSYLDGEVNTLEERVKQLEQDLQDKKRQVSVHEFSVRKLLDQVQELQQQASKDAVQHRGSLPHTQSAEHQQDQRTLPKSWEKEFEAGLDKQKTGPDDEWIHQPGTRGKPVEGGLPQPDIELSVRPRPTKSDMNLVPEEHQHQHDEERRSVTGHEDRSSSQPVYKTNSSSLRRPLRIQSSYPEFQQSSPNMQQLGGVDMLKRQERSAVQHPTAT